MIKLFVILLVSSLALTGCNQSSTQLNVNKSEDGPVVTEERVVGKNGYIFERGERNYELRNSADFETYLQNEEKLFVIFYATWCPYCADLDARVPDILAEYEDIVVLNVDIDQHQDIANSYQVFLTPTVVYFQKGKQPAGFKGALPNDLIFQFLNEAGLEQ